jgi:site-specific DNA-methyltransferase (adenine-specific)
MSHPPARCLNADARVEESYARALGGLRARLLLTDPPYCLLTRRRKGGDLRDPKGVKLDRGPVVRFESVREYRSFTDAWLPRAAAHLEPEAPLVIWTNFLGKEPILAAARALGYPHCHGEFVWAKRTTEREGNEQLLRVYEVALVLGQAPLPQPTPADPPRCWSVVAGYDDDGEAARFGNHPNHKPFSVLEPLLRAYSRPGDLVLDPFAGSGSIPAAALRLSRGAISLEIEGVWAARVSERLRLVAAPASPMLSPCFSESDR